MMNYYRRQDGTICKAVKFRGLKKDGDKRLRDMLELLTEANLQPSHKPEEITDEWVENEAGDDYEQVVLGENIWLEANRDQLNIGDYIIERDGDIYIMAGELFESIWSFIAANDIIELEGPPVMIADICEHCGRSIVNFDTNGEVYKTFKHSEGRQRGLNRCWPEDTGRPYGLDATPRSHK